MGYGYEMKNKIRWWGVMKRRILIMVLVACIAFSQLLGTIAYAVVNSTSTSTSESSLMTKDSGSLTNSSSQMLPSNTGTTDTTNSSSISDIEADRLAEGEFGSSQWYITNDSTLVIQAGKLADTEGESPWIAYKDKIKKIIIDGEVTLSSQSSYLFQNLSELSKFESIEQLKIVEPTKLNSFFAGGSSLKEIDFSEWNTENVIENDDFFKDCETLETIQLGKNSNFQAYEEDSKKDQETFVWEGEQSAKKYGNTSELLSQNAGTADTYLKQETPNSSELIINYLNEENKEIHENKKLLGTLGGNYNIENEEYQLEITGYSLDETKLPEMQGTFNETSQVINFYYKKNVEPTVKTPSVLYKSHVQSIGWQNYVKDGEESGSSGQSKRLEAVQIKLENNELTGKIEYRTHIQSSGWESTFKADDAVSGSTGSAKRLEAIQVKLTGEVSKYFDVYYRVNVQGYGWLDWAKNGESAGTEGLAYRMESLQIRLIKKDSTELTSSPKAFIKLPTLSYRSHVQSIGWQEYVKDGQQSGTNGQKKRLEALQIKLENSGLAGSIQYRTHIQSDGWENTFKTSNNTSGTTGQNKRLEALQIQITGELANYFDVYYRVHVQTIGWLSWAKNGESAGTEGIACRMEALEIKLIPKGSSQLISSPKAFVQAPTVSYRSHVQSIGWQNYVENSQTSGTSGQKKRVEAIQIQTKTGTLSGGIQYRTHIQSNGWETSFKSNNAVSGTTGQSKRLEAIQVQLTGEIAKYFDVYYRVHAQTFGWLGWAKNGINAGTEGYAYRLEAIQIKIVPKWGTAPSPTANSYKKKPTKPTLSSFMGTSRANVFNELKRHQNDFYYLNTPFVGTLGNNASVMSPRGNPTSYGPGMNCTGFIAYVTRQAGGNLSAITNRSNQYGGPANGYNWRNALVPNIQYHSYRTVSDLLKGGKAEKGDVIYFEADFSKPNPDCHLGFFWGDTPSQDRFWHQTFPANKMSNIYSATPYSQVYLFKL